MIPGVAALPQRIRFRLTFEVGARGVVEQHFVLNGEQFAAAPGQMRLQCRFMNEQMIEAAIKAVLVDLFLPIARRLACTPILQSMAQSIAAGDGALLEVLRLDNIEGVLFHRAPVGSVVTLILRQLPVTHQGPFADTTLRSENDGVYCAVFVMSPICALDDIRKGTPREARDIRLFLLSDELLEVPAALVEQATTPHDLCGLKIRDIEERLCRFRDRVCGGVVDREALGAFSMQERRTLESVMACAIALGHHRRPFSAMWNAFQ